MHPRSRDIAAQLAGLGAGPGGGADIAIGDVERRQCRFGVLRQAAATRLDKARYRPVAVRRAGLAQYRGTAAQFARQHGQRAAEIEQAVIDTVPEIPVCEVAETMLSAEE